MNPITWSVYYRTGGTDNFQWHTVMNRYGNKTEAQSKCAELNQAGFQAYVERTQILEAVGLPETFEASNPVLIV